MPERPPPTKSDDYPLQEGWTKAFSEKHCKYYFVDTKNKKTQWFDPRDIHWKKETWAECGPDEMPYGWEEAQDPLIGKYWIDHVNQRNVLDDPHNNNTQQQITEVKEEVQQTESLIATKEQDVKEAESVLQQVETKVEELKSVARTIKRDEAKAIMEKLREEEEKAEKLKQVTEEMKTEVTELKEAVTEMKEMTDRLEMDKADQLEQAKRTQQEIEDLQNRAKRDEEEKQKLQEQLVKLTQRLPRDHGMAQEVQSSVQQVIINTTTVDMTTEAPAIIEEDEPAEAKPNSNSRSGSSNNLNAGFSRVDREKELLALKRREKANEEDLKLLRETAEKAKKQIEEALNRKDNEVDSTGRRIKPQWVQDLNQYATKTSGTMRLKLKTKSQESGEGMDFRSKILLFASQSNPGAQGNAAAPGPMGRVNRDIGKLNIRGPARS